jgi:hypothetical protein
MAGEPKLSTAPVSKHFGAMGGQCYLSVFGHFILIEVSAGFFDISVDHQKNFSISSFDLSFALLISEFMFPRRVRSRGFLCIC